MPLTSEVGNVKMALQMIILTSFSCEMRVFTEKADKLYEFGFSLFFFAFGRFPGYFSLRQLFDIQSYLQGILGYFEILKLIKKNTLKFKYKRDIKDQI